MVASVETPRSALTAPSASSSSMAAAPVVWPPSPPPQQPHPMFDPIAPGYSSRSDASGTVPKLLWFFYDRVDPPVDVAAFLARIRRLNPDWTCIYLHQGHDLILTGMVEPPPVPMDIVQRTADWYRLVVVARYGGVWIDASTVHITPVSSWVDLSSTAQLQGFAHPSSNWNGTTAGEYIGQMSQLENWAFAAPPHSPLVLKWLEAFRGALILGPDQYMGLNSTRSRMLMPEDHYEDGYLLQHAAYCEARFELPKAPILVHSAIVPGAPYAIQQECNWAPECIIANTFGRSREQLGMNTTFIKLRGWDRESMKPLQTYADAGNWLAQELVAEVPVGLELVAAPDPCAAWYWLGYYSIVATVLWLGCAVALRSTIFRATKRLVCCCRAPEGEGDALPAK